MGEYKKMKALVFGEVLWDVFPDGKKLGGAPMNFSAHLARFGSKAYLLTAVGRDKLGDMVLENLERLSIEKEFVVVNDEKHTGICNVTLDEHREPSYDLVYDVAYDNITVTKEDIDRINFLNFDVLYFGSLAQRNSVSAKSLSKIVNSCNFKEIFCDINIRQNYYSKELIEKCFKKSTIIKVNRDECLILKKVGIVTSKCCELSEICEFLCKRFALKVVIVTLDCDGAAVYSYDERKLYKYNCQLANVISSVGAGDSFSACFLYNYMNGMGIKSCIERANILGAYVVGFEEAIPDYTEELLQKIKGSK